jgi:hypothetical protein
MIPVRTAGKTDQYEEWEVKERQLGGTRRGGEALVV